MRQPSAPSAPSAPSDPPAPSVVDAPRGTPAPAEAATITEIVTRPDPGLARGTWEAPAWVFWVVLAAVVLGAVSYLLRRLGILRIGSKTRPADAAETSPTSTSNSSKRRPRP